MDTGEGFGSNGEEDLGGDSAEATDFAVLPDIHSPDTAAGVPSNVPTDTSTGGPSGVSAGVQDHSDAEVSDSDVWRAGDYGYGEPGHPYTLDEASIPDGLNGPEAAVTAAHTGASAESDSVMRVLASIRSAVRELAGLPLSSRSDAASRVSVREAFAVKQSVEAMWLGLVADLDARPDAVPRARAGMTAQTFLRTCLNRTPGQAASDVRAAHALAVDADPLRYGMPSMGAALREGTVSREHVDVAVRAMRKIPKDVLDQPLPADVSADVDAGVGEGNSVQDNAESGAVVCAGEAVDAFFTEHSQTLDSVQTARLARGLLAALDPDAHDGFDPQATERRSLTHSVDSNGMVVGRFQLDPVDGAWFTAAIDHFSAPNPDAAESIHDTGAESAGVDNTATNNTGTDDTAIHGTTTNDTTTTGDTATGDTATGDKGAKAAAVGGEGGVTAASGGDTRSGGPADKDGHKTVVRDQRTAGQRNADALTLMARLSLGAAQAGTEKSGEPPRITITTGLDDLYNATATPTANPDPGPETAGPDATGPAASGSDDSTGCGIADTEHVADADHVADAGAEEMATGWDGEAGEANTNDSDGSSTTQPSMGQPSMGQPSTGQPNTSQSSTSQPPPDRPSTSQPPAGRPSTSQPDPDRPSAGRSDGSSASPTGTRTGVWAGGGRAGGRGAYCQQTGPLSQRLLARFACDSILQKALLSSTNTVLDLGRDTRTITRAQRRALNLRDRGCTIPACPAPPQHCDGHHITWWSHGGPTNLDNLALVCGRHHTDIHQRIWDLTLINGVIWARPPDWIDPLRRLIRNTQHQQTDAAHTLGTQLRLALPDQPPHPYPWLKPPDTS